MFKFTEKTLEELRNKINHVEFRGYYLGKGKVNFIVNHLTPILRIDDDTIFYKESITKRLFKEPDLESVYFNEPVNEIGSLVLIDNKKGTLPYRTTFLKADQELFYDIFRYISLIFPSIKAVRWDVSQEPLPNSCPNCGSRDFSSLGPAYARTSGIHFDAKTYAVICRQCGTKYTIKN